MHPVPTPMNYTMLLHAWRGELFSVTSIKTREEGGREGEREEGGRERERGGGSTRGP